MVYIADRLWAGILFVMNMASLSPFQNTLDSQRSFQDSSKVAPDSFVGRGPRFSPPGGRDDSFVCNYTQMVGWEPCSTPSNRACWLRRISDGKEYNISTNYEDEIPIGTTRHYDLELKNGTFDADGLEFPFAKMFNEEYPGPWIQACWGDTIIVNVTNKLPHNGTSIHWHGIRQNLTMHMDGVNGITQCPIAPNDYFVYKFNATQYGSSWYHSHYSVQYADGAVGPLTIHGPTSSEWDEAISPPLIMTDWGHNSAFEAVHTSLLNQDILLNGFGNITRYKNSVVNETIIEDPYSITFEKPEVGQKAKKYLLRIINTSFDSTFIFSIDHHNLTVISADFVPIHPYSQTSVLVGIGQRYNVIVEANPVLYDDGLPLPSDNNFWIRTYVATCFQFGAGDPGYEKTGILRYDDSSNAFPSSKPWPIIPKACSDEEAYNLVPILPWNVTCPIPQFQKGLTDIFSLSHEGAPNPPDPYPLAQWTLAVDAPFDPIRIDYADPTFLNLDNKTWDPLQRMVPEAENGTSKDWIYVVIKGKAGSRLNAHPIHLHGHDFAILEQAYNKTFSIPTLNLTLYNPPRRDVVLLPTSGYIVIAFKADNPGAWLVHCHIAFHISEGLGLQIMERQDFANDFWPKDGSSEAIKEAERVCKNWDYWYANTTNWAVQPEKCAPGTKKEWCFQDDSGV